MPASLFFPPPSPAAGRLAPRKGRVRGRAEAVVVLPQYPYVEVFGVWVLEALLLGAPVVATRFGAVVEFVEHGRHGLSVSSVDEPV